VFSDHSFIPFNNGTQKLGTTSNRWSQLFASTTTISTSDQNLKQDIAELSEAEKRVAVVAKGLIRKFKFKDAVASKGADARFHIGVIAQDLQSAFEAEGLNGYDYGILCSDTYWEGKTKPSSTDPEGRYWSISNEPTEADIEQSQDGFVQKTVLSVRYEELLAFVVSAL